jgi:hypothetical protein
LASAIGWQAILPDILAAGAAARISPPFDEGLRANKVAAAVAKARKFAIWPAVVGAALFFVGPYGPIWGGVALAFWGYLIYGAIQKSKELAHDL